MGSPTKAEIRKGIVTLYSPAVTEQEYIAAEGKLFLDKLFKGNAKKLVATLCENGQLDESDIDELKQFFTMEDDHSGFL